MPMKSILTYWNGSPSSEKQISAAVAAAQQFDAHLSIAAIGYAPEIVGDVPYGYGGLEVREKLNAHAEEDAAKLVVEATERLKIESLRGEAFPLVTTPAELALKFGRRARYADLVVLAQPVGDDFYQGAKRAFEGALFHGDAAVLICTETVNLNPKRVMIAWDGSPVALRAVRRAHPLLVSIDEIEIVLVDASADQMHSAEELALMLSRYDLPTSIARVASDDMTDAEALKRHQIESGAELMISGAYGHSRFRELLLGGVTRDLPGISAVPLFMAR